MIFEEDRVHNTWPQVRLKGSPSFDAIQPRQDSRAIAHGAKLSELRDRALAGYRRFRRDP